MGDHVLDWDNFIKFVSRWNTIECTIGWPTKARPTKEPSGQLCWGKLEPDGE